MKKKHCPLEKEVSKGLREGKISAELQEHIAGCSACRDIALVQGWMKRFKESAWNADMPEKTLPDAESMWNRVYTRTRPDKKLVRKALRPLIFPQVLFYGLIIAGIIYTTVWGFKKFGNILDSRMTSMILPFFGIMMFIVFISLSFCALVIAFDKRKHPI
ncbi:MAG: hypothetical protein JSV17_07760 [Candidatus Aminicenantes bacterium]|nr:MAG: hypothetical protein JSV17_07760 [Candidatus Aminicenantes bacterium]